MTDYNDVEIRRGNVVVSGAGLDERVGYVLSFVYCREWLWRYRFRLSRSYKMRTCEIGKRQRIVCRRSQ